MESYPKAKNANTVPSAIRCYGNVAALDARLGLNLVFGVAGEFSRVRACVRAFVAVWRH